MTNSLQTDHAARFAGGLLAELGSKVSAVSEAHDHPAIAWKRSGLLDLSGSPDGEAKMCPLPLASAADGALLALKAIAPDTSCLPQSGAQLLAERARLMGLQRNGLDSPTGHCRLMQCKDGRIALNLARHEDWDLLPALLRQEARIWAQIETAMASQSAAMLVQRGAEMGMAIAHDAVRPNSAWLRKNLIDERVSSTRRNPLVVDLSSLWAGPLAGNLLHLSGAQVIKVESTNRPDGARGGNSEFFDLLNGGKQCVAFDFRSAAGRASLKALLTKADIVIEASRPRALRQMGIDAEQLFSVSPGKVWLRILAHGDDDNRIGFGDDVGVAAGLPTLMERAWGEPLMVGDAIADPLTGLFGALVALECWQAGGGILAEVSMRDVVRHASELDDQIDLREIARNWQVLAQDCDQPTYPQRKTDGRSEEIGQSTSKLQDVLC